MTWTLAMLTELVNLQKNLINNSKIKISLTVAVAIRLKSELNTKRKITPNHILRHTKVTTFDW